ncbi:MAG: ABC transporter substrate-binding protein [Azospirillaceae bacterium]|nr:ABC transporter substrate-binding protein [Azospirillaceae bacterium]
MMIGLRGAALGVAIATLCAAPAIAKTLVYCSEGSPENFGPQVNTTGTSFDASMPIYSRLVEFVRGKTETTPGLAESWTVSDDGLIYTFKLRHGVKWQTTAAFKPTRDFNADDVIFTFERQWKSDNPFHNISGAAYDYFNDMGMPTLLKSIDKVDDYTVKVVLTRPESPFIADLAMPFGSILSAEYAAQLLKAGAADRIDQDPVGTGPFQLVKYEKDAIVRYKTFADYYGGKQTIDGLVFVITPDASVRYAKLKAGECQVMPYPNPADLAAMKQDAAIDLPHQEGLNIGYLSMNVTKKPFDDKRVRQAINYAIDRKTIVDAVFQGSGTVAKNPIPPIMWSYNNQVTDYPYDPAKAKELLAAAGYPNGFETDLWAMPVQRPYNPNARRMAEMMQADLAKVGITAKIVSYEWGEYRKRMQAGEHQMALFGWTGDNGDPDNFLHVLLGCDAARVGGNNVSKWCDKAFDDLVVKAEQISDQAERAKLYEQAQVIFKEEAPWVTIAHSIVYEPIRKEVTNYKIIPLGLHIFEGVGLK